MRIFSISLLFIGILSCKKPDPAPLPEANFYVANDGCYAPCSLYFYDASKNSVKWEWKFGNGLASSTKNDTVYFDSPGTFETWLFIWNLDNVKDSIRKSIYLN